MSLSEIVVDPQTGEKYTMQEYSMEEMLRMSEAPELSSDEMRAIVDLPSEWLAPQTDSSDDTMKQ